MRTNQTCMLCMVFVVLLAGCVSPKPYATVWSEEWRVSIATPQTDL